MQLERNLTYEQCKKIESATTIIKEGKIQISVLASIDLAMCIGKVKPIIKAFEETAKMPSRVREYYDKINNAKVILEGQEQKTEIQKLNKEYSEDMNEFNHITRELDKIATEKTHKVVLPGIDVAAIEGNSERLPELFDALLPVLIKDGAPLLDAEDSKQ